MTDPSVSGPVRIERPQASGRLVIALFLCMAVVGGVAISALYVAVQASNDAAVAQDAAGRREQADIGGGTNLAVPGPTVTSASPSESTDDEFTPPTTADDSPVITDEPSGPSATPKDFSDLPRSADFAPVYEDSPLEFAPPTCNSSRYSDFDVPSLSNTGLATSDMSYEYDDCSTPPSIGFFEGASFSDITGQNPGGEVTVGDCAEQIRSRLGAGRVIPSPGTTLCISTSTSAAQDFGLKPKMILLKVVSVAPNKTLNIELTAWDLPT